MKKTLIAGAASVALAAMPVLGVFAATGTVEDTLTVTVPGACSMTRAGGDGTYEFGEVANGAEKTVDGSTINVKCNNVGGFYVYAEGAGSGTNGNEMVGDANQTPITTGTPGSDSFWSMKITAVTGDYAPTIINAYSDWAAVPAKLTGTPTDEQKQDKKVVYRTAATNIGDSATGSSFVTHYQVKISDTQEAGTYTGKVKYTLVEPNAGANNI